jgi:thiol-disulfide isomerase/thioredoxin
MVAKDSSLCAVCLVSPVTMQKVEVSDALPFILHHSRTHALVLFVYSGWCPWCIRMMPTWQAVLRKLAETPVDGVLVAQVSGPQNAALIKKASVPGYPSVLVVDRGSCPDEAALDKLKAQIAPRTEESLLKLIDDVRVRNQQQGAATEEIGPLQSASWVALEHVVGGGAHQQQGAAPMGGPAAQTAQARAAPVVSRPLPPAVHPSVVLQTKSLMMGRCGHLFGMPLMRRRGTSGRGLHVLDLVRSVVT